MRNAIKISTNANSASLPRTNATDGLGFVGGFSGFIGPSRDGHRIHSAGMNCRENRLWAGLSAMVVAMWFGHIAGFYCYCAVKDSFAAKNMVGRLRNRIGQGIATNRWEQPLRGATWVLGMAAA